MQHPKELQDFIMDATPERLLPGTHSSHLRWRFLSRLVTPEVPLPSMPCHAGSAFPFHTGNYFSGQRVSSNIRVTYKDAQVIHNGVNQPSLALKLALETALKLALETALKLALETALKLALELALKLELKLAPKLALERRSN